MYIACLVLLQDPSGLVVRTSDCILDAVETPKGNHHFLSTRYSKRVRNKKFQDLAGGWTQDFPMCLGTCRCHLHLYGLTTDHVSTNHYLVLRKWSMFTFWGFHCIQSTTCIQNMCLGTCRCNQYICTCMDLLLSTNVHASTNPPIMTVLWFCEVVCATSYIE